LPAPISRIARTAWSASHFASAACSPCDIAGDSAFFASGRLSVMVATPSLTLQSRSVVPVSNTVSLALMRSSSLLSLNVAQCSYRNRRMKSKSAQFAAGPRPE
jgi:hypothetical protein